MNSQEWFEKAWKDREEVHYRSIFGDLGQNIYCVSGEIFSKVFNQSFDPRWIFSGVFESQPNEKHDTWLYITSGLSNAWEAEEGEVSEYSGIGCEFMIELEEESKWVIPIMQRLIAFQTLLAVGAFAGKAPVALGDRIPMRGPLKPGSATKLTNLLVVENPAFPNEITIGTGKLELLTFVGVSDAEVQFARANTSSDLIDLLKQQTRFPVTQLNRNEVI